MISIILLSYYSSKKIETVYNSINSLLLKKKIPFEFLIIDDGSTDNSYEIAENLELKYENVRAYQLSKNFSSHYSIFAGMSISKGDCAMAIPDDEQFPYDLIPKIYNCWQEGHKIIIPFRETRNDPFVAKQLSTFYYKIMNSLSEIKFPIGGADIFCIDREIIDILNTRIKPINTSSITEVLRLGFSPYYIAYDRPSSDNKKSRWTLKKRLRLAIDTFLSSSSFPIKVISFTGITASMFSIFLIILYGYIYFLGNNKFWGVDVPGWTSIIILISFFSGATLISLGIIAEYIWRIYEEVKDRPGYIIKKKK